MKQRFLGWCGGHDELQNINVQVSILSTPCSLKVTHIFPAGGGTQTRLSTTVSAGMSTSVIGAD